MSDPYISVIVTAHDRRRYLPDALRSLERQTLDKGKFEVIVVKNFEDPISDKVIRRNGWKNIITDIKPLGGKIVIGIEEARGEVITFLEDDDMYVPGRLETIERAFGGRKDIIYFHNDHTDIDEEGNIIPTKRTRFWTTDLIINEKVKSIPCSLDYISILTGANFNSSSIAIKRPLLQDRDLKVLKALPTAVDLYFYAKAFTSRGSIYLSPLELTMYRVHLESFSGSLASLFALAYMREGMSQALKERVRRARLLRSIAILESAPVVYELSRANCNPYNTYWVYYISGKLDWIKYSQKPLLIGRVPLFELLKESTISAYLHKKYYDFAIKASNFLTMATRTSNADDIVDNVSHDKPRVKAPNQLIITLLAISVAIVNYLLQFLPNNIRMKYLDLSFKQELLKVLKERGQQ